MNRPYAYLAPLALLLVLLSGGGKSDHLQADRAKIERLIRNLGSDDFWEREAASRGLVAIGDPAEQALQRAMRDKDPEIRRRAADAVATLAARRADREMAVLQGLWVLKTTEYLGEKADQDPEDELERLFARQRTPAEGREFVENARARRATLTFKGDTFEHHDWVSPLNNRELRPTWSKGTYSLDANRSPKVLARRWQEHDYGGEVYLTRCIYSVQGDTLLLCCNLKYDPTRLPTRFATGEDKDVVLLTYKREKKLANHANSVMSVRL